ncbi:MAG: thioredoxin domain-containing protein [Balneolaceae bacterium]
MSSTRPPERMPNRLKKEKSPYLLQHADNPVDWYPWSEEAFRKAREEDKPVFLSIGYATCHWCHVMAHESFEDEEVARLMNETFVNIKVDREERPDIDNTYMTICQILTRQGGWPLTILMTPDKKPFFAATYIPKESRFNMLGMIDLIPKLEKTWKEERKKVLHSADKISSGFARTLQLEPGNQPDTGLIHQSFQKLKNRYDTNYGGFGSSPKFPSPHNLTFLLQYARSFQNVEALNMVTHTLIKMRLGGIFDQIGFGFHRYSTDPHWLLPHFEKMLYDQAMLMTAYTEAWRSTGDDLFKQTVYEIADYVDEQLTSPDGGFYSAEDADSEGEEGKFYVWEMEEIRSVLGREAAKLAVVIYNLKPEGNFRDESTGQQSGANIPHLGSRLKELAEEHKMEEKKLEEKLEEIRRKLKSKREKRIRPIRDDKILTDWNGLMIAAWARAGETFEEPLFIKKAENAWKFLSDELMDGDNLHHRYRDGEAAVPAMADDYAFLIRGLIELYLATFKTDYLKEATELNSRFLEDCWDPEQGGAYFTGKKSEELLGRQKEIYDGAIPSSNSATAINLLQLARLTGETSLEEKAAQLFRMFSKFLEKAPSGATFAIQALIGATQTSAEVVICGSENSEETQKMIRATRNSMKDPYVLLLKTEENQSRLAELAPFTENFPIKEQPTAYFCHEFTCEAPVYSVKELEKLIRDS